MVIYVVRPDEKRIQSRLFTFMRSFNMIIANALIELIHMIYGLAQGMSLLL